MHKQLTIRYMTWEKSTTSFSNDSKKCKQIASPQMTQITAYIFWSLPNGMARTEHDPKWSPTPNDPQNRPKYDSKWSPTPNYPPIFFTRDWNDPRGIIGMEWDDV